MDFLLFDLDGTLLDTGEGITRGVSYALEHLGVDVADRATLKCFIGPPLKDAFRRFTHLDEERAAQAVVYFREYYVAGGGIFESAPYPGLPEMLRRLKEKGYHLFVATSKPEPIARKILAHFDLTDCFEEICGASLDSSLTEKADIIAHLLAAHPEIDPGRTVMIGDRLHDIEGAHTNHLPCISVLYGFGSEEEFLTYKSDYITPTVASLEALLTGMA